MQFPATTATRLEADQGLDVLTHVDHTHPLISFQIWVETGSLHELPLPGAGLSHLLEHMVFKGTKNFSGDTLVSRVEELGGSWNAYTSQDRTVYYVEGPSEAAEEFLQLLFELVYLPNLPEEDYEMEREVIRREIAMGNDSPQRAAWYGMAKELYPESLKRFPVIGEIDRFDAITHAEMVHYHETRYTFDNSFIILSGDIDAPALLQRIKDMQQQVPKRRLHVIGQPAERILGVSQYATQEFAVTSCKAAVIWQIPEAGHPDILALELLAAVIGGARSSHLYKVLREREELAHGVSAWTYNTKHGKGMFAVSIECETETFTDAHTRLAELIAELDCTGSDSERALERAKKQAYTAQLSTLTTVSGRASDLADNWFETRNLDFTRYYLEQLQHITVADLQRVAEQHLIGRPTLSHALVPKGFQPYLPPSTEAAAEKSLPVLQQLSTGMPLVLGVNRTLPVVTFRLAINAGIRLETEEREGLIALYSRLLGQGTLQRSKEEFAEAIDDLAATLTFSGGNNTFCVSGSCLQEDLDALCDLLLEAILEPNFQPDILERERAILLTRIQESAQDPVRLAFWKSRRALFPDSPYRFSRQGSEESVQQITLEDLTAVHQRIFHESEAVLSVFGDLGTAEEAILERHFSRLPYHPQDVPSLTLTHGSGRHDLTLDKEQAVIVVAYPCADLFSEDLPAFEVLYSLLHLYVGAPLYGATGGARAGILRVM